MPTESSTTSYTERARDSRDPRVVLVREKYFSLRPKPLEQWLWRQNVPPSAERIFWLHWEEGMRSGDWCSQVPLKRVASLTCLDLSTVTRAYQVLIKLGLVRREDPGRDPSNPFQQATAVTEVRVPRELLIELDHHPSRPARNGSATGPQAAQAPRSAPNASTGQGGAVAAPEAPESATAGTQAEVTAVAKPHDPFEGLSGRERVRVIGELRAKFSAAELHQFDEAMRRHHARIAFDETTQLNAEERGRVLQILERMADHNVADARPAAAPSTSSQAPTGPQRLSVFELARLRREVHAVTGRADAPEVVRQVTWSIEEGALRRFRTLHALHIALKKIREGAWTRPNRMPPHWMRAIASPETCRSA